MEAGNIQGKEPTGGNNGNDSGIGNNNEVFDIIETPKNLAWKIWLEKIGKNIGRKKDDIEIDGDIVRVHIPGYSKVLVFDPAEFSFGNQKWTSNNTTSNKERGENKFSKEDFDALIGFAGGSIRDGFMVVGPEGITFFRDVLGLKTGNVYWLSTESSDTTAWGFLLYDNIAHNFHFNKGQHHSRISKLIG